MNRRTTQLTKEEVREWTDLLYRLKEGDIGGIFAKNEGEAVWVDIPDDRSHQKIGGVRNTELDT